MPVLDPIILHRAVKAILPVTEKRSTLPILSHVLLSANGHLDSLALFVGKLLEMNHNATVIPSPRFSALRLG